MRRTLCSTTSNAAKSYVTWKNNIASSNFPPIELSPLSFTEFTMQHFHKYDRNKLAVVDASKPHRRLTYGEVSDDVESVTARLAELGVGKGDVVTLMSPNHVDYFSAIHGICSNGAIVTPVNPQYTYEELEFQMKNAKSEVIIVHPSALAHAMKVRNRIRQIIVLDGNDEDAEEASQMRPYEREGGLIKYSTLKWRPGTRRISAISRPKVAIDAQNDLAVLPYSSGTTGLPKGTMLTHLNMTANLQQSYPGEAKFFRPGDTMISPLPMFHIYAFLLSLNLALFHGITLVTMSKFDLEKFCAGVERYRATRAQIVPPIILNLAKSPLVENYDMSSLRTVLSAAAPLGGNVERQCMERFPGLIVKQAWGMSELSPLGTMTPDDGVVPGSGTVGVPCPSTEVKVVDLETRATLPPGSDGELCVRGPQVMKGYLNAPEKTRECLTPDGWLSTGDIASVDVEGRVYVKDRQKELIKVKGFQVAPAELEALLCTNPGILDAVVIPRPDEQAGEVPRAYVVLRPFPGGDSRCLTELDIVEWAAKHVAPYKRLRGGVVFIDKIPKTASGKILRREVVKLDRERDPVRPSQ